MALSLKGFMPMVSPVIVYSIVGLRDDLMQRATLQTGLLHRGTHRQGLLNHDTLRYDLSGMVFSLVRGGYLKRATRSMG